MKIPVIVLDHPINVPESGPFMAANNIKNVQIDSDVSLKSYAGKRVSVTGVLFGAVTAMDIELVNIRARKVDLIR